ncbi:hypothetical protein CYY_006384 [Polysphondylium violaceum]|uniref:Amino acid permease/ SLC12A domain-containing protein n=1 Tax=Polysphondylium violaceum TaxID=133409 RepID=A0A8J4PSC3_9MYCE|nr:hypothetical protein CYY_006384 [Polysphondylium violaceum]
MTFNEDDPFGDNFGGKGNGADQDNRQLKKNALGLVHCIAMSMSGVGPTTGIFFVFIQLAAVAGTSVPFTMIIGTLCCLSMASTISVFAKHISTSASFYSYVSEGLGKEIGFITGWLMLVGYLILSLQTVIQFSSTTADVITRNTGWDFPWIIAAAIVIVLISTLAYIGINPALKLSLVMVVCETLVVLVFSLIVLIKGGAEGNYPMAFTPAGPYSNGFSGLCRGLVFATLAFLGFETAGTLGRESRNPNKAIPRAVVGSVLLTGAWMVFGMYAMVVATGASEIFHLGNISFPIDSFGRRYVSNWFAVFLDIAGISSTFNVCTCSFNNLYRILFSIGKADINRPLSLLSYTSKKFSTPHAAIIFFTGYMVTLIGVVAAIFGIYTKGSWKIYGYLSFIGTLPLIMVFIITNIAVIPFVRKNHPKEFNVFFHFILPIFSAILFTGILFGNFYPDPPQSPNSYMLIGLGALIGLGIIFMLVLRKKEGALEKMVYLVGSDGNDNYSATSINQDPFH